MNYIIRTSRTHEEHSFNARVFRYEDSFYVAMGTVYQYQADTQAGIT